MLNILGRRTERTNTQAGDRRQRLSWVSLALSLLLPGIVVAAQPAPALTSEGVEEIIVTGSRIRQSGLDSPSPITVINGDAFNDRGVINAEDVLLLLPQVNGVITAEVNNGGDGTAQVALRALEPQRTLVLVNGRRMVPATNDGIVDINSIPVAMIDRVEVVTGGASAIYGSDAMAGVINFILKKDFEGFEINGITGTSQETDAERYGVNVTAGSNFADERGNVTASLGYTKREGVFQSERSYSKIDKSSAGSSVGIAGRLDSQATNCFGYTTDPTCGLTDNYAFNKDGTIRPFINELPETNGGVGDRYNFAPVNYLETPQEKWNLTAIGTYTINEYVNPYVEGTYLSSSTKTQLAPVPMAFPSRPLSLDNPLLTQEVLDLAATRPDPTAPLFFRRRMVETSPRKEDFDFTTYQYTVGSGGLIAGSWNYDMYYIYGETKETDNLYNDISAQRTDAALAGCPPGNLVVDCRVVNFYGPGNISASDAAWLNHGLVADRFRFEQNIFNASATGDIYELPAGPLSGAVGYEWRKNGSDYDPGAPKYKDDLIGFNGQLPISGSFDVNEFFGELKIPVLKDREWAERLDLDAAVRYADYSTVGSQTTWKGSVEWVPVADITLRGVYSRATRAPNVFELFQAGDSNSPTAADPCAWILADGTFQYGGTTTPNAPPPDRAAVCALQGLPGNVPITQSNDQIDELQVGNPDLKEETAKTWSYGFVLQPRWLDNLTMTVDYFDITIDDYIDRVYGGTNGLIDACFNSGVTTQAQYDADPACRLVVRTPSDELFTTLPLGNVAKLETNGVQAEVNYVHDFGEIGSLAVRSLVNYIGEWKLGGDDFVGESTFDHGTIPDLATTTQFTWNWQDLRVGVVWQHFDGVKDSGGCECNVPAMDYFDLSAGYQVTETTAVNMLIGNLADKAPPNVLNGVTNTNTDNAVYDGIGRYYTFSARMKF